MQEYYTFEFQKWAVLLRSIPNVLEAELALDSRRQVPHDTHARGYAMAYSVLQNAVLCVMKDGAEFPLTFKADGRLDSDSIERLFTASSELVFQTYLRIETQLRSDKTHHSRMDH